jgi:hypothetical protein
MLLLNSRLHRHHEGHEEHEEKKRKKGKAKNVGLKSQDDQKKRSVRRENIRSSFGLPWMVRGVSFRERFEGLENERNYHPQGE